MAGANWEGIRNTGATLLRVPQSVVSMSQDEIKHSGIDPKAQNLPSFFPVVFEGGVRALMLVE